MKTTLALVSACILVASCDETAEQDSKLIPLREVFVGTASNQEEWPYRYTLIRDEEGWSGYIQYIEDGRGGVYHQLMGVSSSGDTKIRFGALFGSPAEALMTDWELSLTKTASGYIGLLAPDRSSTVYPRPGLEKPVELLFVPRPSAEGTFQW